MEHILQKEEKVNEKIKVEFGEKNITPFGGMKLFNNFAMNLKLEKKLDENIEMQRRKSKYSTGKILTSVIYALVLDLTRLSDTILFRLDKVLLKISGFKEYPYDTTIGRFLRKFTAPQALKIGEVNVELLKEVRKSYNDKITLDLDSHVLTVYGNQQRAKKGFNPQKRGRKSYHPILCFIGETRDFLWGKFRSGDVYSGKGAKEFLRECLKRLPIYTKHIFVRGDSSFYNHEFLRYIDKKGIKYAIAVRLQEWVKCRLDGIKYTSIGGGIEVGEFQHQAPKSEKPIRMVVVREEIKEGVEEKKVILLFDCKRYNYQVIATNIEDMTPEEGWKFYNGRANVENMIKEGIMGYGLDVTPSHCWGANTAHFFLVMLAYNLMNWFKEFVLGLKVVKKMVKWVRQRFLFIAGRLVKRSRGWVLRLSLDYPWQEEYRKAENRLRVLKF